MSSSSEILLTFVGVNVVNHEIPLSPLSFLFADISSPAFVSN